MPQKFSAIRSPRKAFSNRFARFEQLESRQLMAGNLCDLPTEMQETDEPPSLNALATVVRAEGFVESLRYPDAVPTFAKATALSNRSSARTNGSLWFGNTIDSYRFQVDSAISFQAQLDGLTRNANLFLFDDKGNVLEHSMNPGALADKVSVDLAPGTYYVSVALWSVWGTRYTLDVNMTSPKPPTQVPSTPTNNTPTNNAPTNPGLVPGTTGSDSASPAPSVPAGVLPLAEVAYVGSSRDYGFNAIGAPESWNAGYTGKGVTVAVIDTGVDLDHPDLIQNLYVNPGEIPGNGIDDDRNGYVDDVSGYDFVDRDNNANDLNGHGTHVAGTIAAIRNSIGSTGVAPDAKILPIRVLDRNGSGSDSAVASGIRYAAQLGADIINLSLGGSYSRTIESAIDFAQSLGSLIVVASGNESAAMPSYPARFSATDSAVISVGAVNSSNVRASFSNKVGSSGAVQVDAPGVSIYSTYLNGGFAILSGTSMATPHVAGLAALTLSANPSLSPSEVRNLLTTSAMVSASGSDSVGLADARSSVAYAAAGLKAAPTTSSSSNARAGTRSNVVVRTYDAVEEIMLATPVEVPKSSFLAQSDVNYVDDSRVLQDGEIVEESWSAIDPSTTKLHFVDIAQTKESDEVQLAASSGHVDSLLADSVELEQLLALAIS